LEGTTWAEPSQYLKGNKERLMNYKQENPEEDCWRIIGNKILQWVMTNIPNLFSTVTKKSCNIGVNIINLGPYTHQRNAGNNAQQEGNLGGTMVVSIQALERSRELYKVPRTSGAVEGTPQGT
jgi:hypothetical protein